MSRITLSHLLARLASALALAGVAMTACAQSSSLSDARSSVSPEARAAFAERMRLIDAFTSAIERGTDAAALTASNVVWMREMLYTMSIEQLRSLSTPSSYAQATRDVIAARDARPALGSFSSELVYYPITPCRYIDTRNVGGPITSSRTYDLNLTGGAYGGSMNCDPKQAVGGNEDRIGALAINVAILGPTVAPGFVGVRPAGSTANTALVNWWESGSGVQASNAGIATTDQSGAAAEIEFYGGPSDIVVDVFGVFAAPSATAPDCVMAGYVQAILNTSTRDYDLTPGACPALYAPLSVQCGVASGDYTNGHLQLTKYGIKNPGAVSRCTGRYTGSTTVTVTATARCCRVPGR